MIAGAGAAGHLFLSGFMGTGKSTVGPLLARRLGRGFSDLDALVCAAAERSVAEIFAHEGEAGFRRRERACLAVVLEDEPRVVALGGGAVVDPEVRRRVRAAGTLVTLTARFETVCERLRGDRSRPLIEGGVAAGPEARARALLQVLQARAAGYADADLMVETDDRSPAAVAEAVIAQLALRRVAL